MKALILTDGKAGHENQSRAFARALGCEVEISPVSFKFKGAKTLSYIFDSIGVRTVSLFRFGADVMSMKPDVVIGTGSGTFYAVKSLAKRLGAKSAVVLYPRGYDLKSFDCILAPRFDNPADAPNVVRIPANLVSGDAAFYDAGEAAFLERHSPTGRKACAVIVGGPNKCAGMTAEWMRAELERIFAETEGCERWVTTSRRTPRDVEEVVESFPFDYSLIYSKDHFNPIPAFVKRASRLYVTAESTGMISEACTFGSSEVFVMDNLNAGKSKFRRFVEDLKADGHVGGARKIDLKAVFEKARSLVGGAPAGQTSTMNAKVQ